MYIYMYFFLLAREHLNKQAHTHTRTDKLTDLIIQQVEGEKVNVNNTIIASCNEMS